MMHVSSQICSPYHSYMHRRDANTVTEAEWIINSWLNVLNVLNNVCIKFEFLTWQSEMQSNGNGKMKWHVIGQPCDWRHVLLGLSNFAEYGFCCLIQYGWAAGDRFECVFVFISKCRCDHETVMTEHVPVASVCAALHSSYLQRS